MNRVEKLDGALGEMTEEYRRLLIREFEKEELSFFLHRKCAMGDTGRTDAMPGKWFEEENEMLELEKRMRQLCEERLEPLPEPIRVLEEFIIAQRELREQVKQPWRIADYEGELRNLKNRMAQRLSERRK